MSVLVILVVGSVVCLTGRICSMLVMLWYSGHFHKFIIIHSIDYA